MKVTRLIKKFRHLDHSEEQHMAAILREGAEALNVVKEYLYIEMDKIDHLLDDTATLYGKDGGSLYVAAILARRQTLVKLYKLLDSKIELDVDQTKE